MQFRRVAARLDLVTLRLACEGNMSSLNNPSATTPFTVPSTLSAFYPLGFRYPQHMNPSSPEARAILRYYDATYDEVLFYEFQHQAGKYVSGLVVTD